VTGTSEHFICMAAYFDGHSRAPRTGALNRGDASEIYRRQDGTGPAAPAAAEITKKGDHDDLSQK
jgi:hypothetical protein